MRVVSLIFGVLPILVSSAGLAVAQSPKATAKQAAKLPAATQGTKQPTKQTKGPVAVEVLEQFLNMPPAQREQALAKLPPGRRQQIETRLNNLESLPPEQRAKQLDRAKRLESLPPGRRQAVRQEIQSLREMTLRERRMRLRSDEFNRDYSSEEQQLIREPFPNAVR
jgi:hypothetical protein